MRIVASIGQRALLGSNEGYLAKQPGIARAAGAIAGLAGHAELVVTYGDDLRSPVPSIARRSGSDYMHDVLEAENEGLVGYLLEQRLQEVLPDRQLVTLLTRVEVDPADPAFGSPSHPVGAVVDEETARMLASANGWLMISDSGGRRQRSRLARAGPGPGEQSDRAADLERCHSRVLRWRWNSRRQGPFRGVPRRGCRSREGLLRFDRRERVQGRPAAPSHRCCRRLGRLGLADREARPLGVTRCP